MSDIDISIQVRNNKNYSQQANLMGSPVNLLDTANSKREFRWNISGSVIIDENTTTVFYKKNQEQFFSSFTMGFTGTDFKAVVDALNQLQIGTFNLYQESGNTYIGTFNSDYVFGDLKIYKTSSLDNSFQSGTGFNSNTYSSNIFSGGIIVFGNYTEYNGSATQDFTVLYNNGQINPSYPLFVFPNMQTFIEQSDKKIIIAGAFDYDYPFTYRNIIRLNEDFTIDTTFDAYGGFEGGNIFRLFKNADDSFFALGDFTGYTSGGLVWTYISSNGIALIKSTGEIDTSFVVTTGFDAAAHSLALMSDSKIVIVGSFTSFNGTAAEKIVVVDSTGVIQLDTSNGFENEVFDVVIKDDKIICVGSFVEYKGVSVVFVTRLIEDAGELIIDNTFNPSNISGTYINNVLIQDDGKIILAGRFVYDNNGNPINNIVRLNSDGSLDDSWSIGTGFDLAVSTMQFNADKTAVICAGSFSELDGSLANGIAVINL